MVDFLHKLPKELINTTLLYLEHPVTTIFKEALANNPRLCEPKAKEPQRSNMYLLCLDLTGNNIYDLNYFLFPLYV
jgi:hypothetical protein